MLVLECHGLHDLAFRRAIQSQCPVKQEESFGKIALKKEQNQISAYPDLDDIMIPLTV